MKEPPYTLSYQREKRERLIKLKYGASKPRPLNLVQSSKDNI